MSFGHPSNKLRNLAILLLVVVFGGIQLTQTVLALSDAQLKLLQQGIYYFTADDTSSVCTDSPGQVTSSSNLDYAGRPILGTGPRVLLSANLQTYQDAASQEDIPWQILAAVHYRESNFSTKAPLDHTSDGQYQITDGGSRTAGAYPDQPGQQLTPEQFKQQTVDAAKFLKKKNSELNGTPTVETVKKTLWLYNGTGDPLYKNQAKALGFNPDSEAYEGSPYVMNFANAERDPTVAPAGSWLQWLSRTAKGKANSQYGAFLVYSSLSGSLTVSNGCAGSSGCSDPSANATAGLAQVRETVVCLAQQELAKWDPKTGSLKPGTDYFDYSQGNPENWCADFVSWVYNQSGYPLKPAPNWRLSVVSSIYEVGQQNDNFFWHPTAGYTPRPGDIAIFANDKNPKDTRSSVKDFYHTNIVAGVNGTQMTLIGGNQNSQDGNFDTSSVGSYSSSFSQDGKILGFVSPDN